MNPELTEWERTVREWKIEADSVIEKTYKNRIAEAKLEADKIIKILGC